MFHLSSADLVVDGDTVVVTQGFCKGRDLTKPKPTGRLYFPAAPHIAAFIKGVV